MDKKLSAKQVFTMWKTEVEKDVGKARYTATERLEQLDALCEYFVKYGVTYDDAMDYKKEFVNFVVTREGMKGNGQYKGWKEKAAENYEGLVTSWYNGEFTIVNDPAAVKTKTSELYDSHTYLARMPLIVAWTKHKYQENWSEAICLEAHKIGGPLWIMFKKEVIESKWAKEGKRPNWAKNAY